MKMKNPIVRPKVLSSSRHFNKTTAVAVVGVLALVGIAIIFRSRAAAPFADLELGSSSTITAPASVVANDQTASGGSAVKFGNAVNPPQNKNCVAIPSACGFADATNTGILPGVTLTKVPSQATSGPGWTYVTSPNNQINITGNVGSATTGLELADGVEAYVYGSNITIKNLKLLGIHGQSADGITVLATTDNVKIEYCDITGAPDSVGTVSSQRGWNAVHIKNGASNYTVNYCHIRGFSGGIFPEQEKGTNTFIGNYIHHMVSIDNTNLDHCNVWGNGGGPDDLTSKQLIKDNTFLGDHPFCMSSSISLFPDGNTQTNQHTVIEHNLLTCGGYYCINPGYGNAFGAAGRSYIAFKNNHWSTRDNPNGGFNGISYVFPLDASSGAGNYQCGNIWDDGPLAGSGADQSNSYPASTQPVTTCPSPAPW